MTDITIRQFEAADAEAVRAVFQSPHVVRGRGMARHIAHDPAMLEL
jgi:hypothetical protein